MMVVCRNIYNTGFTFHDARACPYKIQYVHTARRFSMQQSLLSSTNARHSIPHLYTFSHSSIIAGGLNSYLWIMCVSSSVLHLLICRRVNLFIYVINPLKPELNPSAQRCLTRFFTEDFASWTVHFVNTCTSVKNQQIHQLFIKFISYVW
jgi:hypothetical protein